MAHPANRRRSYLLGASEESHDPRLPRYLLLGVTWTLVAIVGNYFFIVRAFHPTDGYYKLDVYLCYVLTLLLPVVVGWWKTRTADHRTAPVGQEWRLSEVARRDHTQHHRGERDPHTDCRHGALR
jgi:hypothetical protein